MRNTLSSFSISKLRFQTWSRFIDVWWFRILQYYSGVLSKWHSTPNNPMIDSYAQALWGNWCSVMCPASWCVSGSHSSYPEHNIRLDNILGSPGNVHRYLGPDSGFLLKFLSKPVHNGSALYWVTGVLRSSFQAGCDAPSRRDLFLPCLSCLSWMLLTLKVFLCVSKIISTSIMAFISS